MPVHMAITRIVLPGREAEFEEGLRQIFQDSFAHGGVLGASMIIPPPGSGSREYGILRAFGSEAEMNAFYASPLFKTWDERAKTMTEGEAKYRQLHGLEAWFRGEAPPRWKMAAATLLGVYPTSLLLYYTVGQVTRGWPAVIGSLVFSACMVAMLTWGVMPFVTRQLQPWLKKS